jgi:prepilin-type N-terminal cleavage/methylation domain-containing protein
MKIQTKYQTKRQNRRSAFTLIEMIGVLAVIAILAALLIPKIFESINNARVNNAAVSCGTVKTAIADHYAKFGTIPIDGSVATPTVFALNTDNAYHYDQVLLREGFLDKPFAVKIGDGVIATTGQTGTRVEVFAGQAGTLPPTANATATTAGNGAYDLDGAGNENDATGSAVVHSVITGVTLNDARDLNTRLDGSSAALGEAGTGGSINPGTESDIRGRVKYTFAGSTATVYVYMTHR